MNIKYPLAENVIDKEDLLALSSWMLQETTPRLTMGDLTKQLEEKAAKWVNRKYCLFVNSGSSANLLMAYALKLSKKLKNNKVLLPNVGWVTSVSPFQMLGFDLHFCRTDEQTFGVDLDYLEQMCRNHDPAVVLFVQPLGALVDKNKLAALQMKYGFYLLEDACGAVGSSYYDGTKAGKIGDMSSWSSFYGHQICTLEGGFVFTDDKMLYNIMTSLRSHGWMRNNDEDIREGIFALDDISPFNQQFHFVYPGLNIRNTDLGAFLGLRQLNKLDWYVEVRDRNHRVYYERLHEHFRIQEINQNDKVSSISFAFITGKEKRTSVVQRLNDYGIENRLYSAGSLVKHPFLRDVANAHYPFFFDEEGEHIHNYGLFVPNTQEMTVEDVNHICDVILNIA